MPQHEKMPCLILGGNFKKPLDKPLMRGYNTRMKEFNNLEIMGDALDEYKAIQEAEAGVEPEMASDEEIKTLLLELWEESFPTPPEEEAYTEEDAFRDCFGERYEEFN